jgi:hypothetical protein
MSQLAVIDGRRCCPRQHLALHANPRVYLYLPALLASTVLPPKVSGRTSAFCGSPSGRRGDDGDVPRVRDDHRRTRWAINALKFSRPKPVPQPYAAVQAEEIQSWQNPKKAMSRPSADQLGILFLSATGLSRPPFQVKPGQLRRLPKKSPFLGA